MPGDSSPIQGTDNRPLKHDCGLLERIDLRRDPAADAAREVMRSGGAIHMIPCSHGDMIEYFVRTPLPGYGPESAKPGDVVRGWVYGPMFQGYYLDPGRTTIAGRTTTAAQRELIETCAGIVEKLIERMKPGTDIAELARYGDRLAAESGADKDQAAEKFPLLRSWHWPLL